MDEREPAETVCEETVFDALFLGVAPLLRNFLYYRCGDAAAAEDLVQDAFLRLWQHCERVTPDRARPWLFRTAENLFLNRAQRAATALKWERRAARAPATAADPQALLEEREFGDRLRAALDALPAGAREVFLLSRTEGLRYREIAELLGISQKAVEKRMHRALVELRKIHESI